MRMEEGNSLPPFYVSQTSGVKMLVDQRFPSFEALTGRVFDLASEPAILMAFTKKNTFPVDVSILKRAG